MNLGVIGTGYVGLVTATCLAEVGHHVFAMDKDLSKINQLQNGELPIYEPGLKELLVENVARKRLHFTTDLEATVEHSDVIFIAVATPEVEQAPRFDNQSSGQEHAQLKTNQQVLISTGQLPDQLSGQLSDQLSNNLPAPNSSNSSAADLKNIFEVARQIAFHMHSDKVIVIKSTVPVGTGQKIEELIREQLAHRQANLKFSVVSNPEFLKEGAAVEDFLRPDRIIIGTDDEHSQNVLKKVYEGFFRLSDRLIFMDRVSSELTKYAANSMLATRISFMNELAQLCEKTGADITKIRQGIGSDHRIGPHFMYPGIGYGGSCLPKDVRALIHTGKQHGLSMSILRGVDQVNTNQRVLFFNKIKNEIKDLKGKVFAVWGLAFKPGTDDVREAPALDLIRLLVAEGATVRAYDPVASLNAERALMGVPNISFNKESTETLMGADALILMTEWREFRNPDFAMIKKSLKSPIIFDGRNQYSITEMKDHGIKYFAIGRVH